MRCPRRVRKYWARRLRCWRMAKACKPMRAQLKCACTETKHEHANTRFALYPRRRASHGRVCSAGCYGHGQAGRHGKPLRLAARLASAIGRALGPGCSQPLPRCPHPRFARRLSALCGPACRLWADAGQWLGRANFHAGHGLRPARHLHSCARAWLCDVRHVCAIAGLGLCGCAFAGRFFAGRSGHVRRHRAAPTGHCVPSLPQQPHR